MSLNRINIGMKAQRAEEIGMQLAGAARDAMNKAGDDAVPGMFEVELEAVNNDGGEQVMVVLSNDDMERDEVALTDLYVEVDND